VPAFLFSADSLPAGISVMTTPFRAVLSPCVGICTMGDDGRCDGCHRTIDEIARWGTLGDGERLRLIEDVLPLREASRANG
jgi:predicted Fe-S protein YdhL (DUF1289 family)